MIDTVFIIFITFMFLPGATTVVGYHGGGRVPARGAWVRRVPVYVSGYKNPKVLGGAGLRYHL